MLGLESTSKRIFITVGLLVLLAAGILFGIILPATKSIRATTDDTYQLRQFLEKRYEQSLQNHVSRRKLNEVKEGVVQFAPYTFGHGDELRLITDLENLASANKMNQQITGSNLDKIANNEATISLNLSGTYLNAFNYLADLDAMNYFINVDAFQISPSFDQNGKLDKVSLDVTLRLYASN